MKFHVTAHKKEGILLAKCTLLSEVEQSFSTAGMTCSPNCLSLLVGVRKLREERVCSHGLPSCLVFGRPHGVDVTIVTGNIGDKEIETIAFDGSDDEEIETITIGNSETKTLETEKSKAPAPFPLFSRETYPSFIPVGARLLRFCGEYGESFMGDSSMTSRADYSTNDDDLPYSLDSPESNLPDSSDLLNSLTTCEECGNRWNGFCSALTRVNTRRSRGRLPLELRHAVRRPRPTPPISDPSLTLNSGILPASLRSI